MGAGTTKLYLEGLEIQVLQEEVPDLTDRHSRVEHQLYHNGVAQVVETILGEGEELIGLFLFEECYLLIQGLVHRLYRV